MKKTLSMLLALVMIVGCFAGCSGSGSGSSVAAGSGSAAESGAASEGAESTGNGGENVVTIGRMVDTSSMNRFMATDGPSLIYSIMTYDSLIKLEADGTYTPSLAKSWEFSEDGTQVTFNLNTGVKFHNGDDLTSADVKYTFERYAHDPNSRSVFDWTSLTSVETPNDQTAVLVFDAPFAAVLPQTAFTYIVSKNACEELGDAVWENPIGSGPWKFESWAPSQEIVFTRNDEYWNWGDNKSNVDKVIIKIIAEDSTRLAAIQTDGVDIIEPLNPDQAAQLESYNDIIVKDTLNAGSVYFYFRTVGIFNDPDVRKAFSLAIDRELIVDTIVGGGQATSWPADSFSLGYKDVEMEYDPDKAAELLAGSSYNGEEFKIIAVNGQVPRISEVLQAVSSMLNQAGFNSSVEFMEMAAFNERRISENYDVYFASVKTAGNDPGSTLITRWMKDSFKSGYVNEEMNALIEQQATMTDPDARNAVIQEIFQMAYDETAPCTPVYQLNTIAAYKDDISGVVFRPDTFTDFTRVMKG